MGIFGSEFSGLLAAMSAGVPAVAVLQTTYDLRARSATISTKRATWYCKWRTIYMMHAMLARIVKVHFVALSQAIKDSAVRHLGLPPERITVIPLGLNPEESDGGLIDQEAARRVKDELGLDEAYPILLNVARLSPVKGQKDLMQAMPRVLERFPQAKLLIAGDGPLLSELEQMRDHLGLQDQVLLLGRRDDIKALLHASDLFVFGSYYEGLPGAIIEAMATGRCVVSFDIPSLRAVIEDKRSGVLVQGRDVERFAEAIVNLAEHRDVARNMGERARQIVKEKYDIRQNVRSLEALYRRMLTRA
jgi:glycosyltransferase involved in cell wall biosynthesis